MIVAPKYGLATPHAEFLTDRSDEILTFAADSFDQGTRVALATLVEIRGGSARALGSHMAIREDGAYCGFVSGGCTEAAVAVDAMDAITKGNDRYMMLGEGSPFFDIVLPCGGGITIAIHVLRDSHAIRTALTGLAKRKRTGLAYDLAKQHLRVSTTPTEHGFKDDVFYTSYLPKTRLVLSGRSIEIETACSLGVAAGYEVHRHEPGEPLPDDMIDQDTAVALLYHDLDRELPILKAALKAKPFYLGALGSTRTHQKRLQALTALGYTTEELAGIKAPIGLFARARTAQALALSVLADIAVAETQAH